MRIEELRTPAFLVDRYRVERNAARMLERAKRLGVRLRPHFKSHKTLEGACLQVGGDIGPITVSTLAEARFLVDRGFVDITYAVPISPDKLREAAELIDSGVKLNILLDSMEAAYFAEEFGRNWGLQFSVFLKVDCGYHRAGIDPGSPESLEVAHKLDRSTFIDFAGILTHAGQAYAARSRDEIVEIARHEARVMMTCVESLSAAGIVCREVSIGSTPTAVCASNLDGITEIRPGNYIFFDKFQADIGSCSIEDCAISVLTRVIGVYPDRKQILIDAGALALSKDAGSTHLGTPVAFGTVLHHPKLRLVGLSQEHGQITTKDSVTREGFPIGRLLQIIPNHACLTAALFDRFHLVDGEEVVSKWIPVRGW